MAKVVKTRAAHRDEGSIIVADCDNGTRTTEWDINLSIEDNHKQAAMFLVASLDGTLEHIYRHSKIESGKLNGLYYHVLVP